MSGFLVVNADDLGVSLGATMGVLRAHRDGIVTSASLAPTTEYYRHAVDTCVRVSPDLGVGLHFTLTAGRAVSAAPDVPLLVKDDGTFRMRFTSIIRALGSSRRPALLAQIATELAAQIARLRTDGIAIDHIDGERHVHIIPGIFELVVAAAQRNGIPFVRAGRDAGGGLFMLGDAVATAVNGGAVKSLVLSTLAARARRHLTPGVRTPDHVVSYLHTGRTDIVLPRLLRTHPAHGITEVMVHPGLPDESTAQPTGNTELDSYLRSPDRRAELAACIAARGATGAWQLTNYGRIAAREAA